MVRPGGVFRGLLVVVAAVWPVVVTTQGVEHPVPPQSCTLPGARRAGCYGQVWSDVPKAVPSGLGTDGPLAGNGDLGVTLGGGSPGQITLYTGKNDFWGIRDVPQEGCPYTIMSTAWLDFQMHASPVVGSPERWTASQDMLRARVNASVVGGGITLSTSTIVAAATNVALTELVASHDTNVTVTFAISLANYEAGSAGPFRTAAVAEPAEGCAAAIFAENTHRRLNFASLLPCTRSAVVWPSLRTIALSTSGVLEVTNGSVTTCLSVLVDGSMVHDADGSSCGTAASKWTSEPSSNPRGGVLLRSQVNRTLCATYGDGSPTDFGSRRVTTVPCTNAQPWVLKGSGIQAANTNLFQQPGEAQCLAAAPPNFNNSVAQAVAIVDAVSKMPVTYAAHPPTADAVKGGASGASVDFTIALKAGRRYMVALSSLSSRDVGSGGDDPLPQAVDTAVRATKEAMNLSSAHAQWWESYWATGASVDLGSSRLLLEGWWYGAQYIFGSATRPGKVAPGLWGPWVTGGKYAGWNGDYTIDYNFQANFWGAVSSNRAAFAQPYFDSMMSLLTLGRMRASAPSWHDGRGFFGPSGQYSQGMQCGVSPTGWAGPLGQCPQGLGNYSGLNFPGHFGPYPDMTFPTDMGIRSVAAFAWTPFMQYYEGTQDKRFLADYAYPYLRGIVDFYVSYLKSSSSDTFLHVPHSCGDEICHYEGRNNLSGDGLDPHEDLAFARMALNKAVEYSTVLGTDAEMRATWQAMRNRLAPFPTTTCALPDPRGSPVVNCTAWGCTCQGISDLYGANAGIGWGCTPPFAQSWYKVHKCKTKSAKYPCHDPPAPCNAPGCAALAPRNVTVFAQSRDLQSGAPLPGLPYVGYPIVYDAGVHPAEVVTRLSEPEVLETARNTVWAEGLQSGFDPTNGFVLSWIPIARIVHQDNASILLDHFTNAVQASSAKSWYHVHGGGGYEDVGATEAVNSMLLLSIGGALHFFPGWPSNEAASFSKLRAYGAFVVNASVDATGTVSAVSILSEAALNCTFSSPWKGDSPRVKTAGGQLVAVVAATSAPPGAQWFTFQTTAGESYELSSAAQL